jgi:threonine/homoserine/homoserine lactone efflux protein
MDSQLLAFVGLAAALTMLPGSDMALVLRSVVAYGRRAGLVTTLGVCSGLTIHASAAALGISTLLAASATAFTTLKLLGGAYLVFLGARMIVTTWRRGGADPGDSAAGVGREERPLASTRGGAVRHAGPTGSGDAAAFATGFVTNVLNPKVAVFYLTILPQFVSPGDPVLRTCLLLGGIHIAMGLVWLSAYVWLLGRIAGVLTRPPVRRAVERVTGSLLVGLGLRLAWARR